ncbi:NAD(P)/FAD-dependent oxidoreductase [Haliangium ochraceum]|uniref:Tryptophan halogenase n=1 Tax=Haliangium ochraceum (strain DSM 14365 / JCM 11303 / SMP-2) TaxID=502025 RepID=D0LZL4_HALO1|nr:NAD(P)/FAD-dependent oxidoreductase [Haliangium ochraceum]ACY17993.1 tryptophan halogenase [Haliangium ochraceum DSM 14365]
MRIPSDCDVAVLGAGPAGSSFAALVKKYAPGLRVVVLERARFPRWRIGESTIPVANAVLRDLGVYERLAASDAVKKIGITFVWGKDRQPWNADYLQLAREGAGEDPGAVLDVVGQDFAGLRREQQSEPFTAFNIRRDRFDALLLEQARGFGAEAFEGVRATSVRREGDEMRVAWSDDDGASGTLNAGFVLDATGLGALMTRGRRERDPHMNNFAVYGYFAGAGWKVTYSGERSHTTVFIASIPHGWIWYFPIAEDVMSVGVVTHRDHFRDRLAGIELETFYREQLAACPEIAPLLADARLRDDVLPGGARVGASQDWSSWAEQPVGPGWAAAGDAAVFVDPILSSGVTLALQSGHRAAYTLLTARAHPEFDRDALWRAYADYLRGEAGAFLKLARFFYGNNRAAESWWWEAQRLVNASGQLDIDPARAFTMATAGFFPLPRALSLEIVGPLITGAAGSDADLRYVHENSGVPAPEQLAEQSYEVLTRFRLALRTEPARSAPPGQLRVFHDLVSDDPAFSHRLAAAPTEISPQLAPVVDALQEERSVRALMDRAPSLVPPHLAQPADARRLAAHIVRVAAIKGFVQLS